MTLHTTKMHRVALGLVAAVTLATACDFSVTNPGPVQDKFLNDPTARAALTTGARRLLGDAMGLGEVEYWGAAMTYEINPAGSTGSYGIPTYIYSGTFHALDNENWDDIQQARWMAEDAIRRFDDEGAPKDSLYAVAYLWAGYANRTLGENFCNVTFDGGPSMPSTAAFARADSQFTQAMSIASSNGLDALVTAAHAGRASVLADLATYNNNDAATWAAAVAQANAVTSNTFTWHLVYSGDDQNQYNYMYWARGDSPYRAHTEWSTWYENYYRQTGDPRVKNVVVPLASSTTSGGSAAGATSIAVASVTDLKLAKNDWVAVGSGQTQEVLHLSAADSSGNTLTFTQALVYAHAAGVPVSDIQLGDAAVDKFGGRVPFMPEAKYNTEASPITLSSGWEMRLIEAEAALVAGDYNTAATIMNVRRAALGLPDLTPANLTEGWTDLKAERGYELWLEARRMGDLRRWLAAADPGTTYDGVWQDTNRDGTPEQIESMTSPTTRDMCFPIGQIETQTNPNLKGG